MKFSLKKSIWTVYLPVSVICSELILQLWCYGSATAKGMLYAAIFGIAASGAAMLICLIKPGRFFRVTLAVTLFLAFLLYSSQAVYFHIFKAFLSLTSVGQAGGVLERFWLEAIIGILQTMPVILPFSLPTVLWLIFGKKLSPENISACHRAAFAAVFLVFQAAGTVCADSDTGGVMSVSYIYSQAYIPELSIRNFGAVTNLKQDLLSLPGIGLSQTISDAKATHSPAESEPEDSSIPAFGSNPETPEVTPTQAPEYNVLEIDFDSLISSEADPDMLSLHEFFSQSEPTEKNGCTGLWEGKNLIWIIAEGFSSWALDEELTPTLYKLANSGFVFENFYNPLWYVSTSDGEFTTLLSLLPRTGVWNMSRSSSCFMPFGMGNMLRERGYSCNAFHDGFVTYYNRHLSHPNLGYDFYANGGGLKVSDTWPPSDLEMMQNSIPMYIDSEPFHTYYMTISGHMYYSFSGNMMSEKHREAVSGLPMSEACQAYIACNMELDLALEELINQLDEAGILENTAIVLSGDHYPYNLAMSEIEELAGGKVDTEFEIYRSTLIMWCADMEEPIHVEKPCYSLDIMPTLMNLFGLDYDSRLVMGRDIFSDSEPLIIFGNRSFITGKGRYSATADSFVSAPDVSWQSAEEEREYAMSVMERVNRMFSISSKIIDNDYYSKILK